LGATEKETEMEKEEEDKEQEEDYKRNKLMNTSVSTFRKEKTHG
jgi:hypothetical protein